MLDKFKLIGQVDKKHADCYWAIVKLWMTVTRGESGPFNEFPVFEFVQNGTIGKFNWLIIGNTVRRVSEFKFHLCRQADNVRFWQQSFNFLLKPCCRTRTRTRTARWVTISKIAQEGILREKGRTLEERGFYIFRDRVRMLFIILPTVKLDIHKWLLVDQLVFWTSQYSQRIMWGFIERVKTWSQNLQTSLKACQGKTWNRFPFLYFPVLEERRIAWWKSDATIFKQYLHFVLLWPSLWLVSLLFP